MFHITMMPPPTPGHELFAARYRSAELTLRTIELDGSARVIIAAIDQILHDKPDTTRA